MAKSDPYIESLESVPLFEHISKKDLKSVASRLTPVDVGAGTTITEQGGGGRDFFVVIRGTAIVNRDGTDRARIRPGGFFGELALLIPHARMATVTAETDMLIGVLRRSDFVALVNEFPSIGVAVMEQLAMLVMDIYPVRHEELLDGTS